MAPLDGGLWAGVMPAGRPRCPVPAAVRLPGRQRLERDDPYRFLPTLGEARPAPRRGGDPRAPLRRARGDPRTVDGVDGVAFAVWAPGARSVRIVGDFDRWDGRDLADALARRVGGVELFVPDIGPGELYKYEVLGADGACASRPTRWASQQLRPESASRVWQLGASLGRRGVARPSAGARPDRAPDGDLRGPSRLVDAPPRWVVAGIPRGGAASGGALPSVRVQPRGVPPPRRASVRRLVGATR